MRRIQTLLVLGTMCFLFNSCAQRHQDPPTCSSGKGGACCTVPSKKKAMTH